MELHHSTSRHLSSSADWQQLNESKTAQQAEVGLVQANQILRLITKFMTTILPIMFMDNQVPIAKFEKAGVKLDYEGTAWQILRRYKSYLEVRTYYPVKMEQLSQIWKFYGLPFKFSPSTGKFIQKQTPADLRFEPGTDITQQEMTPCTLSLVQPDSTTLGCDNVATTLKNLEQILDFGYFTIYMATAVGKTSVRCPGWICSRILISSCSTQAVN